MKNLILIMAGLLSASSVMAQNGGLTDMSKSKFSQMSNTPLGAVKWTGGFWGERFGVYSNTSLQSMWNTWNNPDISHGFRNFEIVILIPHSECDVSILNAHVELIVLHKVIFTIMY